MEKIKVIHDAVGHTLTVWLGDPAAEHVCEETAEELVVMKDASGRVIGFELLQDRKSTRLNSSHSQISYAVFCLKKKTPAVPRSPLFNRAAHYTIYAAFTRTGTMSPTQLRGHPTDPHPPSPARIVRLARRRSPPP